MKTIYLAIWHDKNGDIKFVSIDDYEGFERNKSKDEIADFIYNRLHNRYLKVFQYPNTDFDDQYVNGFAVMANCCLLIETLQCFIEGKEDTRRSGEGEKAFVDFLSNEPLFSDLRGNEANFYKNIRCGILHQGETKGGWLIDHRQQTHSNIFDTSLKIYSREFLKRLDKSLENYSTNLRRADWNDDIWAKFRLKMSFIIANC